MLRFYAFYIYLQLICVNYMNYSIKSDYIGASASFLCFLHCIVTPVFFFVATCTQVCCSGTPIWWQAIDYVFIVISFIAIFSVSKVAKKLIIGLLWSCWAALAFFMLNEQFLFFFIFNEIKYIPALLIVLLHMYNIKFCNTCNTCTTV